MSDVTPTPGEPDRDRVGEPIAEDAPVEDVVGSARESLAEAEAVSGSEEPSAEQAPEAEAVAAAPASEPVAAAEPTVSETEVAAAAVSAVVAAEVAEVVTASEPVAPAYAAHPIFVQAPEPPTPRGNRAAAGAIGLLAALSFGVLYLAAGLVLELIRGSVTLGSIGTAFVRELGTWSLWMPVTVFFIAFWLLGAIINRGRWAVWVIFGLLVGLAAYGGHILGQLFQAPFWELTASQGAELADSQLLAPMSVVAFIIGRELTIWFGSWVAARGKRMTELNVEARREYERTLEAGPQLHQL